MPRRATGPICGCLFLLGLALSGCAASITPQALVPASLQGMSHHAKSVAIQVTGGKESDPTGLPQVSNAVFTEALTTAVQQSRVFDAVVPRGGAAYLLSVQIVSLQQPLLGGTFTVTMEAGWQLLDLGTGQVAWQKGITSSHTVSIGEAFAGPTRVRLATEGAARENIRQGLQMLSQLVI